MLKICFLIAFITCAVLQTSIAAHDAETSGVEGKKIIMWSGIGGSSGQPTPTELTSIGPDRADALPVNGMIYNISYNGGYFADRCLGDSNPILWDDIRADVDLMKGFVFRNLTDNFARVNTGSINCDWFDDAGWRKRIAKVRLASRAAKQSGAIGFMLDSEMYVYPPFNYTLQAHRLEKSFDEYRAEVRRRGKQFAEALTSYMPDAKIYMTFSNSADYLWGGKTPGPDRVMGLMPAFLDGMMDGAPDAEFIDGYEIAYHYRSYSQFKQARDLIKGSAATLSFDPERYKRRIKVSYGLWLRASDGAEGKLHTDDYSKNTFTPEELRHALHYAMRLSDGYIWLYSFPWFTMPGEYTQAIKDARQPQALDFKPIPRPDEGKLKGNQATAKGRWDTSDEVVFAPHRNAGYKEMYDFPKEWRFRLDPENVGKRDKWYSSYNETDWRDIRIGDWYGSQIQMPYLGYAWYRFEFDAPSDWRGKKLLLAFGAIDEEAWIWVNGKNAGSHALGVDGWNAAFELDVTGRIIPGARNVICVRTYNCSDAGGIWKSVKMWEKF